MLKSLWLGALTAMIATLGFSADPALAKKYRGSYIDAYQAREIAFDVGIVEIRELELDGKKWEIEGWDARHREIELKLDARDGRIIKLERD
ncbi:PepSY domain-containing protein [Methyloligella sp. 2.7D]|uniref:PepSY domain-containing protein n=1 Tax=unclassified Methyloligella TaxID=2625955 RepID=UPI00157E0397|nr:PepSY domain-containing protein [Methyloligella sp. GL2]QKP77967.1 PepSY domain-containing protein [Methyloligella sp. GL2]